MTCESLAGRVNNPELGIPDIEDIHGKSFEGRNLRYFVDLHFVRKN